jgi:hypothetical protein
MRPPCVIVCVNVSRQVRMSRGELPIKPHSLMTAISDNLLLLTSLYYYRATTILKRAQQIKEEVVPQQLPPGIFLDMAAFNAVNRYLEDLYGVKEQDIIDWAINNQTVLRQYKVAWQYNSDECLNGWIGNDYYKMTGKSLRLKPDEVYEPLAFLRDSGNIPPMKLYRLDNDAKYQFSMYPKELGHYGFLINVLRSMMGFDLNSEELVNYTRQFVKDNLGLLDKIRSQFQSEPQKLGSGEDGIAFAIGPYRIFKIFRSKFAYEAAVKAVDSVFSAHPSAGTEAMIYDYGQFKPISGITFYYYIIERMAPMRDVMDHSILDKLIMKVQHLAENSPSISKWKQQLKEPSQMNIVSQEIKKRAEIIKEQIVRDDPTFMKEVKDEISKMENKLEAVFPKSQQQIKPPNVLKINPVQTNLTGQSFKLNPNWFIKLIEESLWKVATERLDLHSGNIGVTSFGDLRYFDPAYS